MVTGVINAWGLSPQQLANMTNGLNNRFTYQLGLSSYPPVLRNGEYISPMTAPNNAYNQVNFGRSKFGNYRTFDPSKRLIYVPQQVGNWNRSCQPCVQRPCPPCNKTLSRLGVNYNCHDRSDKRLILNGKTYSINSKAKYAPNQTGTIIGMGCKQILVLTPNSLVKRVGLEKFVEYNK